MTDLSIEGAAQRLLPPEDGLAHLRLDRAGALRAEPGDVAVAGGRIVALERDDAAVRRIDAGGCAVIPGFVDCHTHLPFAGWRAEEYARKVAGTPYEQIARDGGGIASSASALAQAGDDEVLAQAGGLAAEMLAHGTTTFECKSGYGLSAEGELRALALADRLGEQVPQTTVSTALLAHAVPPGRSADDWMDTVAELVPRTHATALDIYVESVAFGLGHLARMGELASAHGRMLRAHVEQFSTMRSVPVALEHGARSVDHLACLHPDDVAPLARADCAAVLLPAAELLGDEHLAPGRALADAGAIGVLATDANPGTSPVVLDAARDRPGGAPLRLERARGAGRGDAQRRLGARPLARAGLARARQARRPARARRADRAPPLPAGPQPGRGRDRRRRGRARPSRRRLEARMSVTTETIAAAELAGLLRDLIPIGRDGEGATTRLAWTPEDERTRAWFGARAAALGRRVERDPAGNLWAIPDAPPPWWAVGSHLDSVLGGGRFDGALGVAAAFAVAAREPVAVISFADEEGARFNTPTFGSRALAGRLDVADALARVDRDGVRLADALAGAGVDPAGLARAPQWLERLRGFLELHVDQTRELAQAGVPAGAVARLAARVRLQAQLDGRADHAGTTRGEDRRDALATAARLIVRGEELAAARPGMVFTAARIEVEPNAPTTVPARVRLWLDARAPGAADVERWRAELEDAAAQLAERSGVAVTLRTAASSAGTAFSPEVLARLRAGVAAAAGTPGAPALVCYAGHDAGVLADALPTGMVLVRNPSGISHAPQEDVALEDAAVGANALLAAVRELA